MSAESLEIWKNVVLSLIPNGVLLAAAIVILRKMRNWYTIVLVVAAAFNILLPLVSQSILNGRQLLLNDAKNTAATINALPTQQEKEAAVKRETPRLQQMEASLKQKDIYLKWLNDGRYISMLAFAIMLVIVVGTFVPKSAAVPAADLGAEPDKTAAP